MSFGEPSKERRDLLARMVKKGLFASRPAPFYAPIATDNDQEHGHDPRECIAQLRHLAAAHPNPAVVYLASAMAQFEAQ